jgi:hypothetical protein
MTGSEYLQVATERVGYNAVRAKPKLQLRPKDVVNARNMAHLLRKAIGSEKTQLMRRALWAENVKTIRA